MPVKTHRSTRPHAKGNILFIILIAVSLFAFLTHTLMSNTSETMRGADVEKLQLAAREVIMNGTAVKQACNRMRAKGYSSTEILLCPSGDADSTCYPNGTGTETPCTTGHDCLWAPEGGAAAFPSTPNSSLTATSADRPWELHDDGANRVISGVGTGTGEIMVRIYGLRQEVCEAINTELGLSLPLQLDADGFAGGGITTYPGEGIQCMEAWSGGYMFLYTLEAR